MKLYATPLSHFARKVRVLLDLYEIPYEFINVGNVAEANAAAYGPNPMMKVPALVDGDNWLIESDHIASYLAQKYDPSDKYVVNISSVLDLNIRAVLNEIMGEEVKIVLGKRTQIPIEQYAFFDKALLAIRNGLSWLEENYPSVDPQNLKYRDIHLVCLWQHLEYNEITSLEGLNSLGTKVASILKHKVFQQTAPSVLKPK